MSATAGLAALLADERGRELLAANGMYTDVGDFVAALRPAADPALGELLGVAPDRPLVHIGQQACTDYAPSVASKFEVVPILEARGVAVAVLWHDADRAGSEKYGMRIVLPGRNGSRGLWLAHRSMQELELRFVPAEDDRLAEVFSELSRWLISSPGPREQRKARVDALVAAVRGRSADHLGAVNSALSVHLLRVELGLTPATTSLSTMLQRGLLTASLNAFLGALDDVVRVFNEQLLRVEAQGIDAGLKPLNENYLPLFYSCERCGRRLRLAHERSASDHYGAANCRCGEAHRFHLGDVTMSLGELEQTGRWCADVSLPVHHNQLASGWVVGRSSALYGIVFNAVTERVMGQRPIPGLVPPGLGDGFARNGDEPPDEQSLLLAHLMA